MKPPDGLEITYLTLIEPPDGLGPCLLLRTNRMRKTMDAKITKKCAPKVKKNNISIMKNPHYELISLLM